MTVADDEMAPSLMVAFPTTMRSSVALCNVAVADDEIRPTLEITVWFPFPIFVGPTRLTVDEADKFVAFRAPAT